MQFNDEVEESDFDFMLRNLFNHVPGGIRQSGAYIGESYDEFWWRDAVLPEGDYQGTQGYIMVWLHEDGRFNVHHTYHHPGEIYQ